MALLYNLQGFNYFKNYFHFFEHFPLHCLHDVVLFVIVTAITIGLIFHLSDNTKNNDDNITVNKQRVVTAASVACSYYSVVVFSI